MKTKNNKLYYLSSILCGAFIALTTYITNAQTVKSADQKSTTDTAVFNFKAQQQTWIVPEGVTIVHVDAYGAQGGSAKGGKGGRVQSDLKVTPGTKLIINIGSKPTAAEAGYNGGGKGCGNGYGGGGATDIRIGGSELENRVLVAGGGGGFGYGGFAGEGGGLIGGQAKYDTASYHIAYGGTQEAGGAGARAYFSQAGKAGVGGDGIDNRGNCSNGAMGGGGGGYFGGGGSGGGGGAGGSSYTNSSNQRVKHEQGVNEGNGKLILHWERVKK